MEATTANVCQPGELTLIPVTGMKFEYIPVNIRPIHRYFSGLFFQKLEGTRVYQGQEDVDVVAINTLSSTKP